MVRFAQRAEQLEARDAVNEQVQGPNTSTALSFAPRAPALAAQLGLRPMPLGLDLRGGLYLLYQVDVNGAVTQLLEGYAQDARRALTAPRCRSRMSTVAADGSERPNAVRMLLPPDSGRRGARARRCSQTLQDCQLDTESLASGSAIDGSADAGADPASARTTRSSRTSRRCATA